MGRFKKLAELYCTGCRYCMPCPYGVDIPGNFSALNLQRVYGLKEEARKAYARLSRPGPVLHGVRRLQVQVPAED